ncbi:MAG: hypothetical protein LBC39_02570 [Methanobrevibacter sp.]|nr:hypothetical protein [Candidatus Methanovirga aequatorialis]
MDITNSFDYADVFIGNFRTKSPEDIPDTRFGDTYIIDAAGFDVAYVGCVNRVNSALDSCTTLRDGDYRFTTYDSAGEGLRSDKYRTQGIITFLTPTNIQQNFDYTDVTVKTIQININNCNPIIYQNKNLIHYTEDDLLFTAYLTDDTGTINEQFLFECQQCDEKKQTRYTTNLLDYEATNVVLYTNTYQILLTKTHDPEKNNSTQHIFLDADDKVLNYVYHQPMTIKFEDKRHKKEPFTLSLRGSCVDCMENERVIREVFQPGEVKTLDLPVFFWKINTNPNFFFNWTDNTEPIIITATDQLLGCYLAFGRQHNKTRHNIDGLGLSNLIFNAKQFLSENVQFPEMYTYNTSTCKIYLRSSQRQNKIMVIYDLEEIPYPIEFWHTNKTEEVTLEVVNLIQIGDRRTINNPCGTSLITVKGSSYFRLWFNVYSMNNFNMIVQVNMYDEDKTDPETPYKTVNSPIILVDGDFTFFETFWLESNISHISIKILLVNPTNPLIIYFDTVLGTIADSLDEFELISECYSYECLYFLLKNVPSFLYNIVIDAPEIELLSKFKTTNYDNIKDGELLTKGHKEPSTITIPCSMHGVNPDIPIQSDGNAVEKFEWLEQATTEYLLNPRDSDYNLKERQIQFSFDKTCYDVYRIDNIKPDLMNKKGISFDLGLSVAAGKGYTNFSIPLGNPSSRIKYNIKPNNTCRLFKINLKYIGVVERTIRFFTLTNNWNEAIIIFDETIIKPDLESTVNTIELNLYENQLYVNGEYTDYYMIGDLHLEGIINLSAPSDFNITGFNGRMELV